jgi:replicative DNA helicase
MKEQEEIITSGELKPLGFSKAFKEIIQGLDTNVQVGISSGFPALDQLTSGWQKQQLTLIASLSGLGKTSLMAMFAQNAIKSNVPTLIFNFETSATHLYLRMICTEAKVELKQAKIGQMTAEELAAFNLHRRLLRQRPLMIDDSSRLSLSGLKTKILRSKEKYGVQLVCIDFMRYIQTNKQAFESRQAELAYISSELKQIANELQVAIIAVVQLYRSLALEKRAPCLADLEASKNADTVLFLHRSPEVSQGMTELIIAKDKAKPTNVIIPLRFIGKYTYFESLENSEG